MRGNTNEGSRAPLRCGARVLFLRRLRAGELFSRGISQFGDVNTYCCL